MGLMDELRKLTQPYGDDDDFFEGADAAFQPQAPTAADDAQLRFENTFADETSSAPEPAAKRAKAGAAAGGRFGGFSDARQKTAKSSRKPSQTGSDQSVIRFNPSDFDEAGELVNYLEQGKSLIMSLEDLPSDTARRLLDFMSGIAFAVNGKITPVSAKTYFISPENVDLLDAQTSRGSAADESDF